MSKYLDRNKVEQAFKRAARTAASGSRDARAGRFMVQKEEPKAETAPSKVQRKDK
jgi:hypothetical protein